MINNRLNLLKHLLWMALSTLLSCSSPTEIHVSPKGDDHATGTRAHPFKTLTRAQTEVLNRARSLENSQLRVILHEGIYQIQEPLHFSWKDEAGSNNTLIWMAAPNETPIISGAMPLKAKTSPDGLITTSYSGLDNRFDLYVNGQRAQRARTPNHGFFQFEAVKEEVLLQGQGRAPQKARQTLFLPREAQNQLKNLSDSALRKVRFHSFFKWDNTIRYLSEKGPQQATYLTEGAGMKPWNKMNSGTRFFLENYEEALDAPGEWLARNNEIRYLPRESEKAPINELLVPQTSQWLIIEGKPEQKVRNLIFEGLTFQHTNYSLPPTGFEPAQAASTIDAAVMIDHAENIEFRNCSFQHTGQHGIWFRKGVTHSAMDKCLLSDLGGGGVRIGDMMIPTDSLNATGHIRIDNCIIQSGGYNFPSAVGVWIGQSSDNQITHNDIADFRYSGVSVGWTWGYGPSSAQNNHINYNHIHHLGWALLSDMAAVYTLGISQGTQVNHNRVHDIQAFSYGGWGLYTDEGSSHITMANNLVYNTKTGGFHQHYGRENEIRNNVFAYAQQYQLQATRVEDHLSFTFENNIVIGAEGVMLAGAWKNIRVNMDHNCYWFRDGKAFNFVDLDFKTWQQQTGHDQNSLIADPGTIDVIKGTYHLKNAITDSIGFVPFTPDEAGVYGEDEWKKKAHLSETLRKAFREAVQINRKKKKN